MTRLCTLAVLLTLLIPSAGTFAQSIVVLPTDSRLDGPDARQSLLVQRIRDDVLREPIANGLTWSSSDESVAVVEQGVVSPRGNGVAELTVSTGEGDVASTRVQVTGMHLKATAWSFQNHVQPVLAKAGCNSGACHGALAGKGGFKLSLRGYDSEADYRVITQQSRGRRIELTDPGRSLLLAKPTGALPHRGGVRLEVGSDDYRVLAEWIAAGAPGPSSEDARLETLEILPAAVRLPAGTTQPLIVRAHYDDGRVEDVTRWCKFASANEAVTRVSADGRAEVIGPGVGAVTAWFSSRIAICNITSPYDQQAPAEVFLAAPRNNFIDELVLDRLQLLNLPPSPPASDAEFMRRVYLDCVGALPTAEEAAAFLADPASDKRNRLIEQLLSRSEFVDYWAYQWSDLLLVNGNLLRPEAVKSYYLWIRKQVADNTPWDEFARRILTSHGDTLDNGATNFFALHQDPETMTENASQAFLGLSIGCAKCHNHPLEKWTNNQYYAMANLFARVRAKGWGGDARNGDGRRTIYVASRGDLIQPLTGKPQPPTPLDGDPLPMDDPGDRRVYLAQWLTSPDNPYFSRAISNRIWANFFGVGLVEAVDDLRLTNPASNDQLLQAVADYLIQHDFDLKSLMRVIMQSAAYQRSSLPLPENRDERRFYSRYYPKRLMAEVMLDAISDVTEHVSQFDTIEFSGADRQKTDFYPAGTRAVQLYDSAVGSYFLKTFGRHQRRITCDCERSDEPSLVQALHLSNGDTLNKKLEAAGNRIDRLLREDIGTDAMLDDLFLASLTRYPTEKERTALREALAAKDDSQRRIVWEDVYWSVLSSREFLFNH